MASHNPELSLDCKPYSYSLSLKSFGGDQLLDHANKLEDFLARLEEEQLKIDAFKRELPLCMQLLTNAVETSRQQLQAYKVNSQSGRPVLEEFIPLKNPNSVETRQEMTTISSSSSKLVVSDKSNWMTSAQLWSQATNTTDSSVKSHQHQSASLTTSKVETDIGFNVGPKIGSETKYQSRNGGGGGAFTPFSKDRNLCPSPGLRALSDLALASSEKEMEDVKKCSEDVSGKTDKNGGVVVDNEQQGKGSGACSSGETQNIVGNGNSSHNNNNGNNNNNQTHRKARRCWSPDLHRRFVNALQMLGGSQVATPKQIRELMKVDGLTNDEVKSHLQKYRLHTRRPSPQPTGGPGPQLVVLGGIWVPPEYAAAAAAAHGGSTTTIYGPTSHAPSHYCAPPTLPPQEFYASTTAAQPHQLFHHHHQLHLYKTTSNSSPEYGGGNRSESIEDGKSESSSWKGESGENGEKKGSAALREDGEDSNGSDITLKF